MLKEVTFGADGDKLDAFALDEVQRLGDVSDAVKPHLTFVRFRQLLARDDLEQQHQLQTVAEVLLDHLNLRVHLAEMGVAPGSERLQQHNASVTY